MKDPIVGIIFERDKHPAAKTLADLSELDAVFCDEHVPLSEALTRAWDKDAHLILYRVDGDQKGEEWTFARAAKRAPFVTELLAKGGRITVSILVFDYDLPKTPEGAKQTWTPEVLEAFLEQVGGAPELEPSAFYTTLHGARFIYVLSRPVDHLAAEGLARGLMRDWAAKGVELDEACSDWTRLFRLPQVLRDGKRSEASPTFMLLDGGPALDPDSITMGEATADVYAEVSPYNGSQPDPDEVRGLLETDGKNGRPKESDLVKIARTYLQGRDSYGVCFEHRPIDVSRGWNNGVTRLVGQVVGMLARQEGVTPEGVYALLYSGLEQLQAEEDRGARQTDWFEKGWDLVCRMWANEIAQIEADNRQREQQIQEAAKTREQLIAQLSAERPHDVPADEKQREEWFLRRMIASDGRKHHIMRRDGNYNVRPVGDSMLIPMIGELGMTDVIPTTEIRGKSFATRSAQSILNDCATPITDVWCSSRERVAYISGEPGYRVLHIPVHRLNHKLQARFSPEVDEWLRALAGSKYDLLRDWLAHSLTVSRPICALNLYGASSTGKGMLAHGLAECFEGERINDGKVLGRFNLGLLDSPVVRCDEGVPQLKADGTTSVDQAFRSLVSGGALVIEGKMMNPINANIFPRILFTSNDREILRSIVGQRDLTDDDIHAIELRLLSIEVSDEAQRLLTSRGNYAYTSGWVQGEKPSEYTLANHIFWLHQNAKPSQHTTGRLLVEGEVRTNLVRSMRLRSKSAQAVLRALVKLCEAPNPQRGYHAHEGRVWVTPAGVVEFIEKALNGIEADVSLPKAGMVLRQFTAENVGDSKLGKTSPPGTAREQRGRWFEIDLGILYEEAMRYGLDTTRIERLLQQQPNGTFKLAQAKAHAPVD